MWVLISHYFKRRPKEIQDLSGKNITQISTGSTCSFAVTQSGDAYAWGFGENLQLSTGEDVWSTHAIHM